jgi:hypothetical protein
MKTGSSALEAIKRESPERRAVPLRHLQELRQSGTVPILSSETWLHETEHVHGFAAFLGGRGRHRPIHHRTTELLRPHRILFVHIAKTAGTSMRRDGRDRDRRGRVARALGASDRQQHG